jgi:hypothetical protein
LCEGPNLKGEVEMQGQLSLIVYGAWAVSLVLFGAITYQVGKVNGIQFCRGKAKELCDNYLDSIGYKGHRPVK